MFKLLIMVNMNEHSGHWRTPFSLALLSNFHIGDLFNLYKSPFYVKGLLEDLTKLLYMYKYVELFNLIISIQ